MIKKNYQFFDFKENLDKFVDSIINNGKYLVTYRSDLKISIDLII